MKRQLPAVGIMVIVLVLLISGCQESSEKENDDVPSFSTYENMEKGFSIDYPTAWNKYENPPEVPDVDVCLLLRQMKR